MAELDRNDAAADTSHRPNLGKPAQVVVEYMQGHGYDQSFVYSSDAVMLVLATIISDLEKA